jgi:Cu/Ag efflux protein CusF
MTFASRAAAGPVAAILLFAAGPMLSAALPTSAMAQAAGMAGIGGSETVSVRATVKRVDLKSRMVTLVGPQGNTLTLKVSDEVANLPTVKPGAKVNVRYYASTAYVLSSPGAKLPDDSLTAAGVRTAPGQTPGGAVGTRLVVTGLVVGVDTGAHKIDLVNPSGGQVRTISVVTPEGQQNLKLVKVGDTITAVISEALAIALDPAS